LANSDFFKSELFLITLLVPFTLWFIWHTIRYYRSEKKKLKRLHRFAKEGDLGSQRELAEYYRKGKMVKKSCTNAAFWYQKAAIYGDEEAKGFLQNYFENRQKRC